MRKQMLWALVLAGLLTVATAAVAQASKPTVVRSGNTVLTINGDVLPVALPEDRPAPITLQMSGGITTVDGSQPPALRKVVLETAKDGYVRAKGLPACRIDQLTARDTAKAEKACAGAIVGKGHTAIRVAFPESSPFIARGRMIAFNGGVQGGVTTMYIHSYVAVPTPTAVITTVRMKRITPPKGNYGLRSVATIPVIAGGSGSLTSFDLTLHRNYRFHGRKQSYLEGECRRDKLLAHLNAIFADGSSVSGTLVRPCIVRE
jgi:hypothetical protein